MLQPRGALVRHHDVGRRRAEAVPRVVGGVADQEHQPPAHALGQGQGRAGQRAADPLPLPRGVDRQRPQQQCGPVAELERPVADRTHQRGAGAGHVAEFGHRRDAVAIAVGGLALPVGAEGQIQKGLDLRPVLRAFGRDGEHAVFQTAGRERPSPWPGNP